MQVTVYVDGVQHDFNVLNDIKVVIPRGSHELHFNHTHEGQIIDRVGPDGEVTDTCCAMYDDILDDMEPPE